MVDPNALMRFPAAVRCDPAVDAWFEAAEPLRWLVQPWFDVMRGLDHDVRELIHDHAPTACVGDAAFASVNAYKAHAAIGFFQGASLPDPAGLLEGSGKRMRHVKLRPDVAIDEPALAALIRAAYQDMKNRIGGGCRMTPSEKIDRRLAELDDWRGVMLGKLRALIRAADPQIEEQVKWVKPSNPYGVPTWEHAGILCTGEVYRTYVKLTFARGASLPDPAKLFNASLDGGTRRAIDFRDGDTVDEAAFVALIQAAVAANLEQPAKPKKACGVTPSPAARTPAPVPRSRRRCSPR